MYSVYLSIKITLWFILNLQCTSTNVCAFKLFVMPSLLYTDLILFRKGSRICFCFLFLCFRKQSSRGEGRDRTGQVGKGLSNKDFFKKKFVAVLLNTKPMGGAKGLSGLSTKKELFLRLP